jgi:hypothetical protein
MRILVTGGSGFVGSSLCLELKKKYPSYRVTAFDNLRRRGSELNLQEFRQTGVEFIHGDIRNEDDLAGLEGFDVMVEASAEPSVLAGLYSSPSFVIENNLYGSINCFNTCLKHRARLVFLSTSRVYPIDRIENAAYVEEDTRFSFKEQQKEAGISSKGISEELNLHLEPGDFQKAYAKLGRIKKHFVKTIEEDGYDVLCMFHVEFVEGQERLHTFLSKGEGLKETDVFEYHVVRETSFVQADGTLVFGKPSFELQQSDF